MQRLLPAGVALVIALASVAGPARAQCTPSWDDTFSPLTSGGPNHNVWDLAVFDDGSGPALYAAGEFSGASLIAASRVARWDGSAWSALASGIDVVSGSEIVRGLAVFDDGSGPALHAAGNFPGAGGVTASGLVKWDGTSWSAVGPVGAPISGNLDQLAVLDLGGGPELFVTGTVSLDGGATTHEIVRWDGTNATAVARSNGWPYTLAVFDDGSGPALFAGGRFTMIDAPDGIPGFGVPAGLVARWDGTSWHALGGGLSGSDFPRVRTLKVWDDGTGPALYAAGRFDMAGGQPVDNVARWDGTSWSPVGGGVDGPPGVIVEDLEVFDDLQTGPALFACGSFTTAGGAPAMNLARFDGAAWSASGAGTGSFATCLHTWLDDATPSLFLGGGFASVDGHAVQKLARFDTCEQTGFCYGTDALCPCGNGGLATTGCELAQSTGGVGLSLSSFQPDGLGGGDAIFVSNGLPLGSSTRVLLIRSHRGRAPLAFGDGLLCLAGSITRLGARAATGGAVGHAVAHRAGAGTFLYQAWFRNLPASFCDPLAGFNTSNAYAVTWP